MSPRNHSAISRNTSNSITVTPAGRAVQISRRKGRTQGPPLRRKARRPFGGHAEYAFEREARARNRPFVEQTAEQRDAVGHAPRRREFWQRIVWIGCPIAARLRHADESGPQREGGMSREVSNREHLV